MQNNINSAWFMTRFLLQLCWVAICAPLLGCGNLLVLLRAHLCTGTDVIGHPFLFTCQVILMSVHFYLSCWLCKYCLTLCLSALQISLWCLTVLWLVHSILSFLRLYHSHSQQISGPCLSREKELLLGQSHVDCPLPCQHPHPPQPPAVFI